MLKREVDTLSSFWRAEHWAEPAWVPQERLPLPRMSARNLKEVALTFPATTSGSIDGFHPRTLGLLPDEGLEVLAAILQAIEGLGLYPSQQMFLVIQMLGKPKGGYRPIVMFSAIARLWERARRREARAWLASMARPYWAFCRSRS